VGVFLNTVYTAKVGELLGCVENVAVYCERQLWGREWILDWRKNLGLLSVDML